MMKMIRLIALVLALIMVFSAASLAEDANGVTPGSLAAGTVYTGPDYVYDELVVGHTTAMNGNFTTQMWGNNTSDLDVKALVNGYNLIQWNLGQGVFEADSSVVSGLTAYDDALGNRTYIMALHQDLQYSDGTPINAYDYAFAILLSVAKEIRELGGNTENYSAILGMADYKAGKQPVLTGVRVLSDYMLAITVSADYRPFYYELGLLMCEPMPIHVIAPGCQVKDDGEGVCMEGPFTAELLRQTMLDPATGYVSHPAVVSGPYQLISFDGVTAEFEINPLYKGTADGRKPIIRKLVFTLADNETMVEKLASGEFGLLNKVTRVDNIEDGAALAAAGTYRSQEYPRIGQSYVSFCCEKPALQSQAVRQAIALCLDKDQLVMDYAGSYGLRVDGYYGLGQWMYQLVSGEMKPRTASEETRAALEALSLDGMRIYQLDVDEAVRLLEADGWTLNRQGGAFTSGKDDVRCKELDGELTALELKLIYPQGNAVEKSLQAYFVPNLAQAGIALTLEPVEFTQLLEMNNRRVPRDCDMIYMASNFTVVFDPTANFDPADAMVGQVNTTAITDEKLYQLAMDMRSTAPGDVLGYMRKWIAFQERYAEVLPTIPVYSNVYVDFHTACLQDYRISENVTWSQAIVDAYMSDPVTRDNVN